MSNDDVIITEEKEIIKIADKQVVVSLSADQSEIKITDQQVLVKLDQDTFNSIHVSNINGIQGRSIRNEKVSVTDQNTLADIAKTPLDNSIALYVNGKAETEGAAESFTRIDKSLTWSAANAGYDLETIDDVTVHYNTLEA